MEAYETEEETARREFEEETGIPLRGACRTRIRFRNNIYFLVAATSHEHDGCDYKTKDPREIELVRWVDEHDMIQLSPESCNFGLKNWIHMVIHKSEEVRDMMKDLMDMKKNEDPLSFSSESIPQRKRFDDPGALFHMQQDPGSVRRNV